MKPLVYLTGMPASGKTTVSDALRTSSRGVEILEYSQLLAGHLSRKHARDVTHREMRSSSSLIITPQDVSDVDDYLISHSAEVRKTRPVLVVSHPATREVYGYRVLMFSEGLLRRLAPTVVCMLVCSPDTIAERVAKNAEGRPADNAFQTKMHTDIQTSIATTYAYSMGVPAYFLETDGDAKKVVPLLDNLLMGKFV